MTKILVAEDEADIRRLIGLSLRLNKMTSVAVEDGAAAVQQALETPFDLILLDMNMPKLNGLEVGTQIRKAEGPNQHTPILFLTGDPKLEIVPLSKCAILAKPFAISKLITRIKAILNSAV